MKDELIKKKVDIHKVFVFFNTKIQTSFLCLNMCIQLDF